MKEEKGVSRLTEVLFLLLLPYLVTMLLNGTECALLNYKFDWEIALPLLVSSQISAEYDSEAIKCQAVIARTNFYRKWKESGNLWEILNDMKKTIKFTKYQDFFIEDIYRKAVEETKGFVLLYEGEWKLVPYHLCSNGKTRSGEEVFHDKTYQYLQSVESKQDKQADIYMNHIYIPESQMPQTFEILQRDSFGYVMNVSTDARMQEAETFRKQMGLPSADFYVKKTGSFCLFLCRGSGHGLGFSQYGGSALGEQGKEWKEILSIYFPLMEIKKVDRI